MDIQEWLRDARGAGLSDQDIRQQLAASGWPPDQIETLLAPTPPLITKQKKATSDRRPLFIILGALVGAFLIGGVVFAFTQGYFDFLFGTPSAEQLLLKSFATLADAKGGDYGFSFHLAAEPRAAGAEPFQWKTVTGKSPAELLDEDYQTESQASDIQYALKQYFQNHQAYPDNLDQVKSYLSNAAPKQGDGSAFGYTTTTDRSSYTLTFTYRGGDKPEDETLTNVSTIVPTPKPSTSSASALNLDVVDTMSQFIPADLDLSGNFSAFMGNTGDATKPLGTVAAQGSYSSGGSSFNVDIEARLKDGKTYFNIHKFPSFFFFDFSTLLNKWVVYDPSTDAGSSGFFDYSTLSSELPKKDDSKLLRSELPHILPIAFSQGVFTATIDGREKVNDHNTYRVVMKINPDALPAFVTAYKADAQNRNVDISSMNTLLTNLADPNIIDEARGPLKSTTITTWIDTHSSEPVKLELSLVVVPPDRFEKLKTVEFRFTLGETFDHLNEQPNVVVPDGAISMDEVQRLMAGLTPEEWQVKKQYDAITSIRSAFNNYYYQNQSYPATLDQLLQPQKNQTSMLDSPATTPTTTPTQNYFYTYGVTKKIVPTDVYTSQAFSYQPSGDDYALRYTIRLPKTNNDTSDQGFSYQDYSQQFVDGTNTATKEQLSQEYTAAHPNTVSSGFYDNFSPFGSLEDARLKSRDAQRIANIKQIQTALELYYADQGSYPVIKAPQTLHGCLSSNGFAPSCPPYSPKSSVTTYMWMIPMNPAPGGVPYAYASVDASGKSCTTGKCPSYKITFALEGTAGAYGPGSHIATPDGIK